MKNLMKRSMALLLVLFLCLSWLPANLVTVSAANVNYVYDGNYIYNWGSRGTTATFLSPKAEAFYTGSNTYDSLSELSGGTGASDAPNSNLYSALKSLMSGAHSHKTSYDETRGLYKYTDCENSGGAISSFYSGRSIGPDWDSGATWNREHTWPNSKGLGGADENDIMMLRPTHKDENGSRSNTAYGQSAGYYHPNSTSGYELDLRGDVARIFLYIYVRWGNVNGNGEYATWGTRGVMESPEVMLQWMAADPVDTWELGRNDSVQSITGTRNVFVDYPEFAFLLFGEEIPNSMTTPSGEAADAVNCNHNYVADKTVAPTCTTDGYTIYICTLCSKSYQGDKVAASHSFVNGTCTACGEIAYGVVENPVPGTAYKFGMIQENKSKTDVYYLKGGMAQTYYLDTSTDKAAAIDVYLEQTAGGYYFYTLSGSTKQYINMVVNGTHVNGAYEATASTVYTYDAASKTLIAQIDGTPYWFGTRSDKSYTTVGPCATSYQGFYCQFYGDLNQPGDPECKHSNVTVIGKKDATCTEDGHTGKTVCTDCGATTDEGKTIVAFGHNYVNGTCSVCGKQESEQSALVAGKAYKFGMTQGNLNNAVYYLAGGMEGYYMATTTDVSAAIDVYVEETTGGYHFYTYVNGTKTYINMVVSGTHVNGAYQATASTVYTYDATNDTLIAVVNGEDYWFGTRNDKTYDTMGPCKVSYAGFMGQFYDSSTEPENPDAPACQHTTTKVEGTKTATCTEAGHTGKTVCADCGEILNAGSVIPATGHSYVDGTCSVCGEKKPTSSVTTATISFADKAQRTEFNTSKQVWEQNGITVTNLKAASTSSVADYANPARFYASSSLQIEYPGMTKIEFTCSSSSYANELKNSITGATVSGSKVTVTFDAPQDSFQIAKLGKQVRMNSITITAVAAEPTCEHQNTKVEGAVEATCTTDGHTGKTVCADCGEILNAGSVISATGHNFVDGSCTKCGEDDPNYTPDQPTCQHQITKVEGAAEATCTTDGHTGKTVCADCGEILNAGSVLPATGHQNTKLEGTKAATCTEAGHTGKTVCSDCGATVNAGSVIPATGHSYVDGTCSACGEKEPAAPVITTATISFANKAQRTEFNANKQVWEQNGITVTNDKAGSSNNVADYANPARFYASSSLKIEYPGMTKIEFTCNNSTYANDLKNSITGATVSVSGKVVTVTFDAPQDSFQITKLTKQVRMNSITITAEAAPACEHANVTVEGAKAATCTTDGHTGKVTCTDCSEVIDEGQVVPAPGHNYVDHFCSVCGEMDPNAPKYNVYFLVPNGVSAVAPMVSDPNGITLPTAGTVEGYTFLGWVTNAVDNVTQQVEHLKAGDKYVAQQDVSLYALYTYEKTTVTEGTSGTATISFANKAQRTEFNTSKQVWEQNGITVTNDKAGSSNNVADYANPARFYASSSLKIEYPGMTKIEFTCDSSSYATALKNSISGSTVSGSKVTVSFSAPQNSFQIAKLGKQVRMDGISVTYSTPGSEETATYYTTVIGDTCTHSNAALSSKDATCTEPGYKNALYCPDCQTVLVEGETVAALGHTEVTDAAVAPTCTETGLTAGSHCSACDTVLVKQEVVAALGHTEVTDAAVAPTCTETGLTAGSHCPVCDTVLVKQEVVAALGHTEVTDAAVAPTCTETGLTAGSHCSACDTVLVKQEVVAALGHTEVTDAAVAPTCTETGLTAGSHCSVCDTVLVKQEVVAALGHTEVTDAAVAPTCTETGLTAGSHCSVCDTVLVKQEVVAALGHTEVTDAAVAPTCTKTGLTAGSHCSACDIVLVAQERVEALGHKAGAAATCETAQTCVRCDYVYKEALKHKYSETWNTNDEGHWHVCSQCTKKGSYADHSFENGCDLDCSVCGYTRKVEHTLDEKWSSDAKNHWHVCTECGQKQDEAAHEPGAEATATTDQVCTVCGYVIVPALGEPETEATAAPTTEALTTTGPAAPSTDDAKSGAFPWWIVIVAVVLAGGIVILIFKKKEN